MSASSSPNAFPANPTTPPIANDREWITAYLTIHSLSPPSKRYSFVLWITVVLVFCIFAVLHWTGSRGGFIGALWTKWSLRRRTWRKKHNAAVARRRNEPHRQPVSLPSNAQLLSLTILFIASCALAYVGPDYVDPREKVWQVDRYSTDSPVSQRFSTRYDASTFEQYRPNYEISKAWWTSAARSGQIAYALFPLCVLFALKAPPFAIFAVPFMIQLFFDKLAWLHRWSGRLIWLLTFLHVALWSVQLALDHRSTNGSIVYVYAWLYEPFILGWTAFGLLTVLIALSIHPIRRRYYELFYALHLLLVPSTLVFAALHHPTLWYWCWAALALWVGERMWRATWWIYSNGYVPGLHSSTPRLASQPQKPPMPPHQAQNSWEMKHLNLETAPPPRFQVDTQSLRSGSPLSHYYESPYTARPASGDYTPTSGARMSVGTFAQHHYSPSASTFNLDHVSAPYLPPPGYAQAELLAGRTVRLRLITPGYLPWAPGQHFLIHIPHISKFTSHPFTTASICDDNSKCDSGRVIVLLIRAKGGWTLDLYNAVTRLVEQGALHPSGEHPPMDGQNRPPRGVVLKANVDGPFGSSIRARWGNYSTVLVVVGGSGVSFGLAVLQYVCLCLSGRDGKTLGGRPGGWGKKASETQRIRFVWLVREFAHIQWGASVIRTCLSMVPPEAIQIDIYVTNFKPIAPAPDPSQVPHIQLTEDSNAELEPPKPGFRLGGSRSRSHSVDSFESHDDVADSDVDLSYYTGEFEDEPEPWQTEDPVLAHEDNILELTEFDGDHDIVTHSEKNLSQKLRKEGKLRRANSRRATIGRSGRKGRSDKRGGTDEAQAHYPLRHAKRFSAMSTVSSRSTHETAPPVPPLPLPEHPLADAHKSITSEVDLGSQTETLVAPAASENPWQKPRSSGVSMLAPSDAHYHPLTSPMKSSPLSPLPRSANSEAGHVGQPSDDMISPIDAERFSIASSEAMDLNIVSEHARPGKPRLDRILADEVEHSRGQVVVACCGPTSLNAMVRKTIAGQTDPARIRKGDMRGSVALVSEEFEY